MLSNRDFAEQMGKNLLIYPFRYSQMDSCSYDITASSLVWILSTGESAVESRSKGDHIKFPPGETVLVVSQECISLQKKLCGLCCSSVSLSSLGLIMNTTPIKTGWIGKLLIAIHNPTKKEIVISVGDKIAVLLLDRTHLPTNKQAQIKNYATVNLIKSQNICIDRNISGEIDTLTDIDTLRAKVVEDKDYQIFLKERRSQHIKKGALLIGTLVAVLAATAVCSMLLGLEDTISQILIAIIISVIVNLLSQILVFKRK